MSPFRSWWAEVENHSRQPSLQSSMSWWKRLSAQCSMLPPFLTDESPYHQHAESGVSNLPGTAQPLMMLCKAKDGKPKWWATWTSEGGNVGMSKFFPSSVAQSIGTRWKQFHKSHAKWQSENILRRKQTSRACHRTSRNPLKDAKGSERKPEWKRWFYCRSLVYSMFSK